MPVDVLMMPSSVGRSHLTRLVLIAQALRQRGYTVAFGFARADELLQHEGFDVYPIRDIPTPDFRKTPNPNLYAAYDPPTIEDLLADERQLYQQVGAKIVVGDLRPTVAISARLEQRLYVVVVNAYATDWFNPVSTMIDPSARPLAHWFASRVGGYFHRRQKRQVSRWLRHAAFRWGVRGLKSIGKFYEGDLTLLADIPQFVPLQQQLPASAQFIGPLIWEGTDQTPRDYTPSGKFLIYATLGNTAHPALGRLIIQTFGGNDQIDVLLTTGGTANPAEFDAPRNVTIRRFVAGSAVLRHASLAIHAGGNGTTYQVLAHGVPSLVLPINADQAINARLLQKHGLGRALPINDTPPDRLYQAAQALAMGDDDLHDRLADVQAVIQASDAPDAAATAIAGLLR